MTASTFFEPSISAFLDESFTVFFEESCTAAFEELTFAGIGVDLRFELLERRLILKYLK